MGDWEKCRELQKLSGLLATGRPLSRNFLAHIRNCEVCSFWATWALAIYKALANTDRLLRPRCPSRSQFEELLFGAVYGLRKPGIEKMNKYIFHVSDLRLWEAVAHMNRDNENLCLDCARYYDTLYTKMIDYQKEIALTLENGDDIEYPIKDVAQEFNAEEIYDQKKKPN